MKDNRETINSEELNHVNGGTVFPEVLAVVKEGTVVAGNSGEEARLVPYPRKGDLQP